MPYVLLSSYSKFYHAATNTDFRSVLNQQTGCFVAVADVDDETAEILAETPGFEILTDEQYAQLSELPTPSEPEPSQTGDPLTDQAATKTDTVNADLLNGPKPPASK